MLSAIGGIRAVMAETMLTMAPFLNSWRRFSSVIYSPASTSWGREDRNVALRIPDGAPKSRHFEHRIAGVDANPYLIAAVTLGCALDGILAETDVDIQTADLPGSWQAAIDCFAASDAMRRILGPELHQGFAAIKSAEFDQMARQVTDIEWKKYGFIV